MANDLDEIRIRGLRIFAHHGVFPEETRLGQMFVVNAALYTSTRKGGLAELGEEPVGAAAREGKAHLILVASDASDHTWRRAKSFAAGTDQQVVRLPKRSKGEWLSGQIF